MRVIIIECEPEELDDVLERFNIAPDHRGETVIVSSHAAAREDTADEGVAADTSTPLTNEQKQTLRMIWRHLRTGAQEVLTEIANRPDEYPFDELDTQMRAKSPTWRPKLRTGYMSSIGHQWEPYRHRGIPPLLERNWYRRTYSMDPRVAELIRELADSPRQRSLP